MDITDLENRFTYHAPKKTQPLQYEEIREMALIFAKRLNELCPESREKSLAVTHLEDAVMWANAAIARHQK